MKHHFVRSLAVIIAIVFSLSTILYAQSPTISAFTPTSAATGATVIISGSNFTNVTAVNFGGVAASNYLVISTSAIVAYVGAGATGNISVITSAGTGSLSGFTFIAPPPTISSFSPSSGVVGTTVTIIGTNFNTTPTNNIVYFGAVRATVTAATASSLTVTVPTGATYQPITVTNNNLTAFSAKPFIVTFTGGGSSFTSSSFQANQNFAIGYSTINPAVSDIDGDGKIDVLVTNETNSSVSIFRNISTQSGSISFASKINLSVSANPMCIDVHDLDGDGKPEMLVASSTYSNLGIYRNVSSIGNLAFTAAINFGTGATPSSIVVSDIDGDGKPDILVSNSASNTISIFLNTSTVGNISFAAKVDITSGSAPWKIALGDIDGDGKQDVVSSNQGSNSISVFLNRSIIGNVSFASKIDISAATAPRGISIGDIDGDGKLDVVTSNAYGATGYSISVLRNTSNIGSVSFASRFDAPALTGGFTLDVALGDVDGDGKIDVVAANGSTANAVSVFKNNSNLGSVSFSNAVNFGVGINPNSLLVADMDADGNADILSTNDNTSSSSFSVLRNQIGSPVITSFTPTSAAAGTSVIISGSNFTNVTGISFGGVAASSFTVVSSNAIVATVSTGASGNIIVTTNSGSASIAGFVFSVPVPTISSFSPTSGAIGTTVTITGTNFSSIPANNIVYFGAVKAIVSASTSTSVSVIVPIGATYQPITVTTNNLTAFSAKSFSVTFAGGGNAFTNNTFSSKIDFATGTGPNTIAVSDIDGDGKIDMVTSNGTSNTLSIIRNISTVGSVSFSSKVDFITNYSPSGVAVADFDGDGKMDIAFVNYNSNVLGIFKNNSAASNMTLSSEIDYTTSSSPNWVAVGDIDGDGKPDIVVGNASNRTVSVFLNTSTSTTISFAAKVDYNVGNGNTGIYVVAVGDIDGDGKTDIVSSNYSDATVSISRNTSTNGNLSFANVVTQAIGHAPRCVSIGDLDGDGKIDIVVGNSAATSISILKNTSTVGNITFNSPLDFQTGAGTVPIAVSIADLDGDGKPDISVADLASANVVSVFRNNSSVGSISFDASVNYATSANPNDVKTADLDGDGKPEIIATAASANAVSILKNQVGNPAITSFTPTSAIAGTSVIISGNNFTNVTGVSFGGVAATSFTVISSSAIVATVGNGASGVVTVTTSTNTTSLAGFTLVVPIPTITSFSPTSGAIGTTVTITGTNFSSIAANNIVWFGSVKAVVTAATTTLLTVTVPAGATYLPITVTVNNLIAASSKPFSVTFTGGGTAFTVSSFSAKIDSAVGSAPESVTISDIDGDGKLDIIATNQNGNTISILRNTSVGVKNISFASKVDISTSTFPLGGCATDLDGDGKPDLVIVSHNGNKVGVFRNTSTVGNISMASEIDYATGSSPYSVAVGDLNGDGKPDLAVCNSSSHTISVYLNTSTVGNLSFTNKIDYTVSGYVVGVAIGDMDGDGKLDIIATNNSPYTVSVLRNTSSGNGNLSFAAYRDFTTGNGAYSTAIGDLDGDGKLDLVTTNEPAGTLSVLKNNSSIGSLSFASKVDYASQSGALPSYLCLTDMDGDGKVDIATVSGFATTFSSVSLFRNSSNLGAISFETPVNYTSSAGAFNIFSGDLDGDGKPDIVSASSSVNTVSIFRNQIGEPVITSFTPNAASLGGAVIISGSNFTNVTGVSFGGVAATSFTVVSSTAIIATVGKGASGNITVTTSTGSASFAGFVFSSPAPIVTSFSPKIATSGTTVTIKGFAFTGVSAVSFGGTLAVSFVVVNDSTITAIVGSGASGVVSILNNGVSASLAGFTYCEATTSITNASVCSGSSYTFNGSTYTKAGTYNVHLTNATGCDSIATLNLTVKTNATSITNASTCQGFPYNFNGNIYTVSGTYVVHLNNSIGCDSAATLNLVVKSNSSSITSASICAGGAYTFNGTTYTQAGSYVAHLTNAVGCDSAATLNLVVKSNSSSITNASICSGGSYTFNGTIYTQAGSYVAHLTNAVGCDSAATLILTVKTTSASTTNATINLGNLYLFNGTNYAVAGTYTVHLTNAVGCDSAATLVLTVTTITNYTVSGTVKNPLGTSIPSVSIAVNGTQTTTSDASGNYSISSTANSNNIIMPSKNNDKTVANGINGTDISLIQSHILKKVILNSPYKLIAADVNNDGAVNGTDIALIKSLILKHITQFSGNRLWSFIDSSYKFPVPTKPFPYFDSISISNITSNQVAKNFIGVKLGDVNYDWNAAVLGIDSRATPIELFNDNIVVNSATSEVRVPIKVKNFRNIMGMQYTLNFNSDALELKSVVNNHLNVDYNTDYATDGKIPFLWVDAASEARTLSDSAVLFELVFNKKAYFIKEDINLTSDVTAINAFDGNYNTVSIRKVGGEISENMYVANTMTVYPNPAKESIVIKGNHIDKIQVIDNFGKVIKLISLHDASNPAIKVGSLTSGVYHLRMITSDGKVNAVNFIKE